MPYSIGEVAQRTGIAASTLRYYDKEGLLPAVERTAGGIRVFNDSDLEQLKVIECLKKTGMSIKDIKRFIDWCQVGDEACTHRQAMFHERRDAVRAQMDELRRTLDTIEYKCWYYDTAVAAGDAGAPGRVPLEELPDGIRAARERMLEELGDLGSGEQREQ